MSLVYGSRCSPGLSGSRCLYITVLPTCGTLQYVGINRSTREDEARAQGRRGYSLWVNPPGADRDLSTSRRRQRGGGAKIRGKRPQTQERGAGRREERWRLVGGGCRRIPGGQHLVPGEEVGSGCYKRGGYKYELLLMGGGRIEEEKNDR